MKCNVYITFIIMIMVGFIHKVQAHKNDDQVSIAPKISELDSKQERYEYRLKSYETVAHKLTCLSDQQIADLVAHDENWPVRHGKTGIITIDGISVFVKKIPLTNLELQVGNIRSTANIFNLPLFYQYGVGSAGFSAYRELAALTIASDWVLTGMSENFTLLYHARILSNQFVPTEKSLDRINQRVAYWNNSETVRYRIESIYQATSAIVIFCEAIPQNLHEYLMQKAQEGKSQFDAAVQMIDHDLQQTVSFMADHGMIHFDAHGHNILTDGHQLYFSDFGLATSYLFDLSGEEKDFFIEHKNYDKIYVQADLVFNICEALQFQGQEAVEQLQKYSTGDTTIVYSPYITSVLQKYARSALLVDEFMTKLRKESKLTPYPAQEIKEVLMQVNQNKG